MDEHLCKLCGAKSPAVKFSVSVPSALLDAAKAKMGVESHSKIVQVALASYLEKGD